MSLRSGLDRANHAASPGVEEGTQLLTDRWKTQAGYDAIADAYDRFWGGVMVEPTLAMIDRFGPATGVGRGAEDVARRTSSYPVLDLCCGSGQLAERLVARGHPVVGVDVAAALLAIARRRAPGAGFVRADMRNFALAGPFPLIVCAFDSLNHLPSISDLRAAVSAVSRHLAPGGRFLFDVNLPDGFAERMSGSFAEGSDDLAVSVRATHAGLTGRYEVAVFRAGRSAPRRPWSRQDVVLTQRCFRLEQILDALESAGLLAIAVLDGDEDLGWVDHAGRAFVVAQSPLL